MIFFGHFSIEQRRELVLYSVTLTGFSHTITSNWLQFRYKRVFSYLYSKSGVEEQNDHKNVNKIMNHSLKRTTIVSFNFFPSEN